MGLFLLRFRTSLWLPPFQHHVRCGFYAYRSGDLEVTGPLGMGGPASSIRVGLRGEQTTRPWCRQGAAHRSAPAWMPQQQDSWSITGKDVILVDAAPAPWFGGGRPFRGNGGQVSAAGGYTPEGSRSRLVTPPFTSDHIGGLTLQDGKRSFQCRGLRGGRKGSDSWLSPRRAIRRKGPPKDAHTFFQGPRQRHRSAVHQGRQDGTRFSGPEPCGRHHTCSGCTVIPRKSRL